MRALPTTGLAIALLAVAACGRPVADVERGSGIQAASAGQYGERSRTRRTPGQPRLAALLADDAEPRAPLATFSRYNGLGPSDARVPSGVRESQTTRRSGPSDDSEQDLPSRDVVSLLSPARPTPPSDRPRRAATSPEPRIVALAQAPAPTPRPAAPESRPVTPSVAEPTPTPAAPVAAAPVAPRIASLTAPSLSAPRSLDQTPADFPQFGGIASAEGGIPLGAVPASLGAVNIEGGEAVPFASGGLEESNADSSGAISWGEASALIEAGEVERFDDIGQFELLLTLCSGRGVIAIQPTPTALKDLSVPEIICGKQANLTPR